MFDKGVKLVFDLGARYDNRMFFFKGHKNKIKIFQSKLNKKVMSLQIGKINNFNFDTLRKMCHLDLAA
jgi:hypothetical protein